MNTQIKHRIVGGLVLLALLAIFLPIVFHSSRSPSQLQLSTVIPKPPQPQIELQMPANQAVVSPDNNIQTTQSTANIQSNASSNNIVSMANEHSQNNNSTPMALTNSQQSTVAASPNSAQQIVTNSQPSTVIASSNSAREIPSVQTPRSSHELNSQSVNESSVTTALPSQPMPQNEIEKNTIQRPTIASSKNIHKSSAVKKIDNKLGQNSSYPKTISSLIHAKAWVIQVGTFKDQKNAEQMVKRLRAKGYDAYIQKTANLSRVFVGPEILLNKTQQIQLKLRKELKLAGVIRMYGEVH